MIGSIKGIIEYREDSSLIIDVNGVGYRVLVPENVLNQINGIGETIKLFIHTHVREDLIELYGFFQPQDLKLFQHLINVSGVGCKTALGIFSVGQRRDIIHAITKNDVDFFTAVPRLGKKNAQKIIIELKSKLGGGEDIDLSSTDKETDEVTAALKTFGYTKEEVQHALHSIKSENLTTSEKIRQALRYLGK
jgi:Holliday junction DNA helicase RuvA